MKKFVEFFLRKITGKKRLQKFWLGWYKLSLRGMNYGSAGNINESGEMYVINYVKDKFKNEELLTIFDVGANIGSYTVALSEYFKENAIIHSFEPSVKTYEKLLENIKGISNIIPNNVGLSNKESKLILFTNEEESVFASVYQRNIAHLGISMNKTEEAKFTTIDNYCLENNIQMIHFLKLDIEGHELSAFKGAEQLINNNKISCIQFEFGGSNVDSGTHFLDFYSYLKGKYKIYRILKDGLIEINDYNERVEVFLTSNYFAELK
jgi:FkbM family methyltransferase